MKKIEYKAPEMEIVKLKNQIALLSASGGEGEQATGGGEVW